MNKQPFYLASLIAGVVMALLSTLPLVNMVNCLLCFWVWTSGILGVYLYRRLSRENPMLSTGQAAGLGALAGVVGAILGAILDTLFRGGIAATLSILETIPGFSSQVQNIPYDFLRTGGFSVFNLFTNLVFYVIFGTIGGILAVSLIWKSPAAKKP